MTRILQAYKQAALSTVTSVEGDHLGIAFTTADGPVHLRVAVPELLLIAADLKAQPKRVAGEAEKPARSA